MRKFIRPTQIKFGDRHTIDGPKSYKAFNAVWKQIVKEEYARNVCNSDIGPLLILRNIMIEKDIYSGFTPMLQPNDLRNGRGFIGGFELAYRRLYWAMKSDNISNLTSKIHRMLLAVDPFPNTRRISESMYDNITFDCCQYARTYCSRVQKMIIELQDNGEDLQNSTFFELFDRFDNDFMYNIIREKEYQTNRFTKEEFQKKLTEFAHEWIKIQNFTCRRSLKSVEITKDPNWLFENSEGEDTRNDTVLSDTIVITLNPRPNRKDDDQYLVPVKYLWEVDWIKESPE